MKTISIFAAAAIMLMSCSKPKDGATGPQGPTGNANVQTVNFTVYTWTLSGNSKFWYYDYPMAINTNAAVMVYINVGGTYVAIPYTLYDQQFYFSYTSYQLELAVNSASGSTAVSNPGTGTFKVVIIPPGMKKENIDYKNYAEVKKAFQLED